MAEMFIFCTELLSEEDGELDMKDMDNRDEKNRKDIFEKVVRAGKRTYFFDVKSTRNNDHYVTITESKRKYSDNGSHSYQKHKIFLYKEDFEKFAEALSQTVNKTMDLNRQNNSEMEDKVSNHFTDLKFEDLEVQSNGRSENGE